MRAQVRASRSSISAMQRMFHQTYHTKNFDNLNPDAGVMACSATIKLLVSHAHAAPTERLENNLTLQGSFYYRSLQYIAVVLLLRAACAKAFYASKQ